MYGCSKCRGNGCVRCRPELITALLPVVWATIASAYAVISHAQGVQSAVESFIELNLAADDANGLDSVIWQDGTDNRSRGRLNKRYLTREDRAGLPPDGIQRPRKKLKGDRDVASIRRSPFGNTTLTTLTRLSLPEFDALLNKRSTKLNKAPDAHVSTPGTQHTLSTLIELPQNLPRRGKRKFTDTEVYARKQKRRGKPRLSQGPGLGGAGFHTYALAIISTFKCDNTLTTFRSHPRFALSGSSEGRKCHNKSPLFYATILLRSGRIHSGPK